jgi:hypothetical protein
VDLKSNPSPSLKLLRQMAEGRAQRRLAAIPRRE